MERENVLMDIIKKDKEIENFKINYERMSTLTHDIDKKKDEFVKNLNDLVVNSIKDKRIMVDIIDDKNDRNHDKIGLGTHGFGHCWRYGGNLSERNSELMTRKDLILSNYDVFIKGVKKTYKDRYNIFNNALKIIPQTNTIVKTTRSLPKDFNTTNYGDYRIEGKILKVESRLNEYHSNNLGLYNDEVDRYSGDTIYHTDLSHYVRYYSLIPMINCLLIEHNAKLDMIHKSLQQFENSKEYQSVLKELASIKMLKEL